MDRDYTIIGPDGREFTITGPDNANPEELRAAAERAFKALPVQEVESPGTTWQQRLMQNVAAGLVRGAGSIGATLVAPYDMFNDWQKGDRGKNLSSLITGEEKPTRNKERRQAMDDALASLGADTGSIGYGLGKITGEVGGTAGVGPVMAGLGRAIPALASRAGPALDAVASSGARAGGLTGLRAMPARILGGGITGGVSAAAIDPEYAGMGAAVGAGLPPGVAALGAVGGKVGSLLRPSVNNPALAEKAINQYKIPLGVSDISESGVIKGARSALDDSWLVGGLGRNRRENVQGAFNRAVGETFGESAPKLTPQVIDSAKQRMGSEFNRIWGNNSLKIDGQFVQDLQRIESDAISKLNPEQAAQVSRQVQNLLQKAQGTDIPGSFANNWQSELRMVAESEKGLHKKLLEDLRRAAISAFNRSVSPADAAALTMNRQQYKAFKTVEPILQKAEAGTAGRAVGDVSAGLLPEAVRQSYRGGIASSPFSDLTQIGSQFVADRVPKTGGSSRAMVQNTLLGGALTGGAMTNPALTGGLLGGAYGLEALLSSPGAARAMLPSNGSAAALRQLELQRLLSLTAPATVDGQ